MKKQQIKHETVAEGFDSAQGVDGVYRPRKDFPTTSGCAKLARAPERKPPKTYGK